MHLDLTNKTYNEWIPGKDYYRLDGKTPKSLRHDMVKVFNDVLNTRTRVFLISAKAGGQGINLIGANRVIILDTSWNPSSDQQNIFRVFRLGQKRNCYIYRLLAMVRERQALSILSVLFSRYLYLWNFLLGYNGGKGLLTFGDQTGHEFSCCG